MKKIFTCIAITAAVILTPNLVKAQLVLGGQTGVNFSTITNLNSNATNPGVSAGIIVGYRFMPSVSLLSGLELSQKGSRSNDNNPFFGNTFAAFNLNYLQIPVLGQYDYAIGATPISVYGLAGPVMGFATCGNSKVRLGGETEKESYEFDNEFGLDGRKDRRFDLGIRVGIGANYELGCGQLGFGYHFTGGLLGINNYEGGAPNGIRRNRNIVHNLAFRYIFSPKKGNK